MQRERMMVGDGPKNMIEAVNQEQEDQSVSQSARRRAAS